MKSTIPHSIRRHGRLHVARKQEGAILIAAVILLLLFGGLAYSTFNTTLTNSKTVGNMQWRAESLSAANEVLEDVASSTAFAETPDAVAANQYDIDVNGDGVNDVMVTFPEITMEGVTFRGPRCIRYTNIAISSLSADRASDIPCYGTSADQFSGIFFDTTAATPSICSNTEWVMTVRADDAVTNTSVDVSQGLSMRTFRSDAENACAGS